jgi:hypothetical protein
MIRDLAPFLIIIVIGVSAIGMARLVQWSYSTKRRHQRAARAAQKQAQQRRDVRRQRFSA